MTKGNFEFPRGNMISNEMNEQCKTFNTAPYLKSILNIRLISGNQRRVYQNFRSDVVSNLRRMQGSPSGQIWVTEMGEEWSSRKLQKGRHFSEKRAIDRDYVRRADPLNMYLGATQKRYVNLC